MGDITLSKAVRSNLLNLQSTAAAMGKTQERLATGNRVNSALDNPTNYFTASSLNSRASDMGRLLDSVSNAVQTIAAADKGLTAITKLVESAQATARQALQAPGEKITNKVVGDSAATFNPMTLSNVTGDNSTPGALTADASAVFTTATIAADATISATATSDFGASTDLLSAVAPAPALTNGESLQLNVDGTNYTLNFVTSGNATARAGSAAAGYTMDIGIDETVADLGTALNSLLSGSGVTAADAAGVITMTSAASVNSLRLDDGSAGATLTKLGLNGVGTAVTADPGARLKTSNSTIQALAAAAASFTVKVGANATETITFGTGSGQVADKGQLISALNNLTYVDATGSAGAGTALTLNNADLTDADSSIVLSSSTAGVAALFGTLDSGSTTTKTQTATNLLTANSFTDGSTLNLKVGNSPALTIAFGNGAGQVSTQKELNTKLQTLAGGSASINSDGELNITSDAPGGLIKISGSAAELTKLGVSAGETGNLLGSNIAQGDKLKVKVGTNAEATLTFGSGTGEINSLEKLETALGNIAGATATIDDKTGAITIEASNGSDSITITSEDSVGASKDSVADSFGLNNSATAIASTTEKSTTRTSLENQYNTLLTQINQLAEDASFNGVNLLSGDDLSVIFNEDGSSKLEIKGGSFNSTGLGLSKLAADTFQDDASITDTLKQLDTAITSLRSQAATFGSNLSVVETRQDFTKNMINVLETGAANLTLADTNEEAANLLALQTRQQLSSTALSMASQADQNVLRLF